MKQNVSKSELTRLIASGHEQEALNKIIGLAELQNQETQQLIYILSNRYKKLQKGLLIGNISSENAAIRSADINYDLLNLIEQLSFSTKENPIKENHNDENLSEIKNDNSTTVTISSTIIIRAVLLALVLLASFFYFKNQFLNNQSASYQESWLGEWTQEKEADGKVLLPGSLLLYQEGNQWKGKSNNILTRGENTTDSLFNIRFLEDGKKLTGNWVNSDAVYFPELKGTFTFELDVDGKKSFKGKYSSSVQNSSSKPKEFVWNGIKKE